MDVEITGRHVLITPAIRSYVMKRLRKFNRFFGPEASFHVIIDVEKERHTAEILLKSKLLDLTGKGETSDMYSSILRAMEKLERQVITNKARLIETKRQRAKAKSVAEKSGVGAGLGSGRARRSRPEMREELSGTALAVFEENVPRRLMTIEEAAAELQQYEYPFVVFRNLESRAVSVLYRRKDGSLGLIRE